MGFCDYRLYRERLGWKRQQYPFSCDDSIRGPPASTHWGLDSLLFGVALAASISHAPTQLGSCAHHLFRLPFISRENICIFPPTFSPDEPTDAGYLVTIYRSATSLLLASAVIANQIVPASSLMGN